MTHKILPSAVLFTSWCQQWQWRWFPGSNCVTDDDDFDDDINGSNYVTDDDDFDDDTNGSNYVNSDNDEDFDDDDIIDDGDADDSNDVKNINADNGRLWRTILGIKTLNFHHEYITNN